MPPTSPAPTSRSAAASVSARPCSHPREPTQAETSERGSPARVISASVGEGRLERPRPRSAGPRRRPATVRASAATARVAGRRGPPPTRAWSRRGGRGTGPPPRAPIAGDVGVPPHVAPRPSVERRSRWATWCRRRSGPPSTGPSIVRTGFDGAERGRDAPATRRRRRPHPSGRRGRRTAGPRRAPRARLVDRAERCLPAAHAHRPADASPARGARGARRRRGRRAASAPPSSSTTPNFGRDGADDAADQLLLDSSASDLVEVDDRGRVVPVQRAGDDRPGSASRRGSSRARPASTSARPAPSSVACTPRSWRFAREVSSTAPEPHAGRQTAPTDRRLRRRDHAARAAGPAAASRRRSARGSSTPGHEPRTPARYRRRHEPDGTTGVGQAALRAVATIARCRSPRAS